MRFGPLVVAVVLAVIAGFVAMRMTAGEAPPPEPTVVAQPAPQQAETSNVYVAAQFIPIGTVVTRELVTMQPWPANLVGATFITDQQPPESVIGKVARASFQQGEPVSLTKLAGPGEGSFLAGSLPKGMRAVTINTDETLGVAGFVFPGDRVDILFGHKVPSWNTLTESVDTEPLSETLLSDVQVLAVDQIANAQEIAANAESAEGGQAPSTIHVARTVTLLVTPVDAEKLRLAESVGQLSLALRSIEDKGTVDMAALLRYQNVTQFPLDAVKDPSKSGNGVRVIRGIEATDVSPVSAPSPIVIPTLPNPLVQSSPAASDAVSDAAPTPAPAPLP